MKGRQQQAVYAARTIRAFLDGSCRGYDWDGFIFCPLRDPDLNRIRREAGDVELPVDDDGRETLLNLADEAACLAR